MAIVVWALHFAVIYGFTGLACARGWAGAVPWVVSIATVVAAAACVAILVTRLRRRESFEHGLAAGVAGLALVAILWEGLPVFLVDACV